MPRQSGGCDVGLLLGDEGMAGGREAVAIVEDVTAHLGELLGAVGVERFALLVGGPCRPLLVEQPLVIATPRQLSGVVEHPLVERSRSRGAAAPHQCQVAGYPSTSTAQRAPGASASRRSAVTSAASSASASATYAAS